jgi:formylglycine-generating enzyme required for sulfatase activity
MAFIPAGVKNLRECGAPRECRTETPRVVGAFLLDRFEVASIDYVACVEDGACAPSPYVFAREEPDVPALVQWDHARAYCAWRGARIPTSIEWQSAARGGDDRLYPWGNGRLERCAEVTLAECGNRVEVGSGARDVTKDGVYDMSGSVEEWMTDTRHHRQVRGYSDEPLTMFWLPREGAWHGFRCARDI